MSNKRKTVFLDRDGTIIKEVEYLQNPHLIKLLPMADKGIALLKKAGFLIIVVTNQSGIGNGKLTTNGLTRIHVEMSRLLQNSSYDALYYCPHLPEDKCRCRKPAPGLILRATREQNVDLTRSFMVGDRKADVDLGKNIGLMTALVPSSWSSFDGDYNTFGADFIGADLLEVAEWIISHDAHR